MVAAYLAQVPLVDNPYQQLETIQGFREWDVARLIGAAEALSPFQHAWCLSVMDELLEKPIAIPFRSGLAEHSQSSGRGTPSGLVGIRAGLESVRRRSRSGGAT